MHRILPATVSRTLVCELSVCWLRGIGEAPGLVEEDAVLDAGFILIVSTVKIIRNYLGVEFENVEEDRPAVGGG